LIVGDEYRAVRRAHRDAIRRRAERNTLRCDCEFVAAATGQRGSQAAGGEGEADGAAQGG
jgi:hypothetical protein